VLNVGKGLLLLASHALSVGDVEKATSYCAVVLNHCKLMRRNLEEASGEAEVSFVPCSRLTPLSPPQYSVTVCRAMVSQLSAWASSILIANEPNFAEALHVFEAAPVQECPQLDKTSLYLQVC
jgi:hypothetical protein